MSLHGSMQSVVMLLSNLQLGAKLKKTVTSTTRRIGETSCIVIRN